MAAACPWNRVGRAGDVSAPVAATRDRLVSVPWPGLLGAAIFADDSSTPSIRRHLAAGVDLPRLGQHRPLVCDRPGRHRHDPGRPLAGHARPGQVPNRDSLARDSCLRDHCLPVESLAIRRVHDPARVLFIRPDARGSQGGFVAVFPCLLRGRPAIPGRDGLLPSAGTELPFLCPQSQTMALGAIPSMAVAGGREWHSNSHSSVFCRHGRPNASVEPGRILSPS